MILTKYNISILLIFLISALFPNKSNDDLLYNYYIQNSSSNTIESDLIHTLEFRDTSLEIDGKYENFLNEYYGKYEKENLRFINAIVEPDIFYISTSIGASNIIVGENKYSFGRTIGFHIDSPYAFKIFKKIIVIGLKSTFTSLPPTNSLTWDNFRALNMSSTYSMKFGKRIYSLAGLGLALNSNDTETNNILPLISLDIAYELPWKPLNIPFDITLSSSTAWDVKNIYFGLNILLCKPYRLKL